MGAMDCSMFSDCERFPSLKYKSLFSRAPNISVGSGRVGSCLEKFILNSK